MAEAVDLAVRSGIDGFVVEYEATEVNNQRIEYIVAAADAHDDFKLAYTLDIDILATRNSGSVPPQVLDTGLQAVTAYSGHPSQLVRRRQAGRIRLRRIQDHPHGVAGGP